MKSILLRTLIYSSIALTSVTMRPVRAQETALASLPASMRAPVPDAVLYRIFFHHIVAFEKAARPMRQKEHREFVSATT